MAQLTKFERLFGDEAEGYQSTPALIDVNPNLITGSSRYSSKNLNVGRRAVTGRAFRSPIVRSQDPRQTPTPTPIVPETIEEAEAEFLPIGLDPEPFGDRDSEGSSPSSLANRESLAYRGSDFGAENAGQAVGDSIAGQLGTLGVAGATTGVAAGLALGAPNDMLASLALQGFTTTALNPINVANAVGGGVVSGQLGYSAAQDLEGLTLSESQRDLIGAEATKETSSPFGLLGLGVRELGAALGWGRSSRTIADETASQFGAMDHIKNRNDAFLAEAQNFGGSAISNDNAFYGGSDSGLVGPTDTNEAISEAFGVDPALAHEGSPAVGPGSGLSNTLADALASIGLDSPRGTGPGGLIGADGMVHGLFGSGVDPHAPNPGGGIGSSSGNFGGGGSSGGTTGVSDTGSNYGGGRGREGFDGGGGDSSGLGGGPPGGPGDSGHGW